MNAPVFLLGPFAIENAAIRPRQFRKNEQAERC
jgi:hypothetical protein